MNRKHFKTITLINGRRVKRREARISVFDNSLLYAEGLFEAFLAIDYRILFLEEHLRRLSRGARVLGLKIPIKKTQLKDWLYRAARLHPDRIKKIRLTITSGESPKWAGQQGPSQVIISASSHEMPVKPYRLFVSDYRLDHKSIFRRIKTLSYIVHAVALRKAVRSKFDDALLLNENGHISEVTTANIFWVRKGKIFTPTLASGCLEGVTRKIVLREAEKIGLKTREKDENLQSLLQADEIFLSSSLKLIIGVSSIKYEGHIYKFPEGPITDKLKKHFHLLVNI